MTKVAQPLKSHNVLFIISKVKTSIKPEKIEKVLKKIFSLAGERNVQDLKCRVIIKCYIHLSAIVLDAPCGMQTEIECFL